MPDVWPFPPQRKLKEYMDWMTDVIRSKSAEQRLCLRKVPRTSLKYEFQLLQQEIEAATNMGRNWGADEFDVPFWHELDLVGSLTATQSTIMVDTTKRRYKEGSRAFIISADGTYETVTITTVNSDSLVLTSPYVVFNHTGAVIMPCYPARVKTPFKFKKYASDFYRAENEFILTEDFGLTPTNSYPTFNSSYVVTDRPIVKGTLDESHTREFQGFQNISGPLFYSKTYTYPVGNSSLSWSFDNDSDLWDFRLWMYDVKGKQGSFYTPRWTRDFILGASITDTDNFIIVENNAYLTDSYTGPICIVKQDGTQVYLIITSWESAGGGQYKMNLSTTVGESLTASEIEMITRMPKMRFNSDKIEFNYAGSKVVDVRLPIMEVPA